LQRKVVSKPRRMKKIAFIINPISGTRGKKRLPKTIMEQIDATQWDAEIVFTARKGHGTELARHFAEQQYDAVVAVGGDGTVNEVAAGVRDTETALGIVPCGSGNGLARHLQLPLRTKQAIQLLNRSETIRADYGLANDIPFFCTCGSGFDAHISQQFALAGKRGLGTYLEHILRDLFTYKQDTYHLLGEGIDLTTKAFLITFANANQWGNAAYIAPNASIQDGKMDIAILSKFPLIAAPAIAFKLMTKTLRKDMFLTHLTAREIVLDRKNGGAFHYDGEPTKLGKQIRIRIVENGIKLLVGKRF